ncbi:cyclin-U1-1-like [Silene latifolia]|uniref:cyclin-U1-1-like n=1 Tax=Silene latifolia TaxID=37657 RepID=UPI003D787077
MLTTTQDFDDPNEAAAIEPSTPRVLLLLASALERLVTRNVQLVDQTVSNSTPNGFLGAGVNLKVFDGVRAPNISIPKYLERLYKYTECSPSCFVVAYIYIDRLVHKHPEMMLLHHNVHRLVLTTLVVASKILDDVQYNNAFYAKVGGVSNVELNRLELELLFLLDFKVTVSSHVFESYCWYLEKDDVKTCNTNTNRIIQDVLHFDLNLITDINAT